ncbi:ubiquitin-like protein 7 [Actinia tenebrosa]|uniref:Ubiquitin-like protein 7 n=1 Tax=Actinia tenebrosa TaxID=6105 RepID=A0A6P8IDS7_ACTTE|nr:ubiquitin-like protein 7 [Actinia tenebrosa]
MPFIRLKEATSLQKHQVEGIEWSEKVCELKDRASKVMNIPVVEQNLIYGGQLMKDNMALSSYGIQDGCTVHVVRKFPQIEPTEPEGSGASIENVMQVLEAAIKSPAYRTTVEKILTNPEMMEQLVAATPGLSKDLTAMALLQDQELLQQVIETADIEQVVQQHPSLVEAASYIAAATATEGGQGRSGLQNVRSILAADESDEDMPDVEPGVLARAEMIAAREEVIQASGRPVPVTPSMLQSALASAGLPSSSPTEGPSRSTGTPQRVTRDMFTDAITTALSGRAAAAAATAAVNTSNSPNTEPPSNAQLQNQLQQLRDMGITDDEVSLRALRATGGNVQAALEFIFGGT